MEFSDYFMVSPSSSSGLAWAKDIHNGRLKNILMFSKGDPCGTIHKDGHWSVAFRYKGRQIRRYCHRILWELIYGDCSSDLTVDHINGIRSDNSVDNLRLVSKRANCRNSKMNSNNTSGVAGVSYSVVGPYSYAVASWVDDTGNRRIKNFSIAKLGAEAAFKAATDHRAEMIAKINQTSLDVYTDRHGADVK